MRMLIFGLGYCATRVAGALPGAAIAATTRDGRGGTIRFDDCAAVAAAIGRATHILASIPPVGEGDPVLAAHGDAIARSGAWLGYLSSTGVYGDVGGAWVDERAPIRGRRAGRNASDTAWLAMGARVLRLPGIYGPGRSVLERLRERTAHRVDVPGQVFSRVHVDDVAAGVLAALAAPAGAYNLADDLPASQNAIVDYGAALLGIAPPPLIGIDDPALSPAARAFYAENRRVANGKARRVLGWRPRYPDYRLGLRALSASTSPNIASAAPSAASQDQR